MKYSLFLFFVSMFFYSFSQNVAVALDKMNILYAGIDNPVTIAVANRPAKSLIVKTTNGTITGQNGAYIYRGNTMGTAEISVYLKKGNKLVRQGSSFFRVKNIPPPVFKIGSGKSAVSKAEIANQNYVRAELENFDFDIRFTIDSFSVYFIPSDTCICALIKNIGNKINDTLKTALQKLKPNDQLVFKNIYAKHPNGESIELYPVFVRINE